MKVFWAPWRMEYILSDKEEVDCIFCLGDDRPKDSERLILHIGHMSMVMMNKYPYINAHLLVAPLRHVSGLDQLSNEETMDLLLMVSKSIEILKLAIHPEGFNVGLNLGKAAGAGVEEHLHFHIVPRWNGDTNFMPVLGEVKVISQDLMETKSKLLKAYSKL